MKKKNGFTLLELLVVVVIIGILAAIALPQYQMAVGKSKFATLKDNARAIRNALDRYYLANDNYTLNLNDLDVEIKHDRCVIGSNHLIQCSTHIFGSSMGFDLGYDTRYHQQGCFVLSDATNKKANKLCQMETGKTTPQEDMVTFKAYYYN